MFLHQTSSGSGYPDDAVPLWPERTRSGPRRRGWSVFGYSQTGICWQSSCYFSGWVFAPHRCETTPAWRSGRTPSALLRGLYPSRRPSTLTGRPGQPL
uniref:Uncharacterized protein n=1 Tax=Anguilla anguilla TaxID=7936 RepID=A0A0E9Y0J0_ANGAN